ncbi:MAG TPA: sugar ABC transporter permease [Actinophytocola sp.]|uniref:carbohydrate ABC transporter permease n=1 Tax=Actinophytocola sp. TaxID=1872138 RepID=UPI002DDC9508|nr:sugar ABC transporter permease [Actinophytocola sp.]HEV2782530.1 sugar ABC transporter permease [Actinophytocola sp.]
MAAPQALKDSLGAVDVARESSAASPRPSRDSAARRPLTGWLFVAPTGIVVAGLFLAPLVILVYMSFTDWPLLGSPVPNGLDNYRSLGDDDLFVGAITFTLVYTAITTVVLFLIAFVLVAISNSARRGVRFYRTAYFLPYVVGVAAASTMWWLDAQDQIGLFNQVLKGLGLIDQPVGFLETPGKALFTVIALVVWKFIGFQVIVLLVGLQSIPHEYYEAAKVDGASTWQRLRYITVPSLKPTLALLTVLSITGSLLAFDQFYVLTHGGPDNSTVTVVLALYNRAFQSFQLGDAAAQAVVLLVVLVVINVIQLRLLRNRES